MTQPTMTLLVKLGSIAVHVDELLSPHASPMHDEAAIRTLLDDPEVKAWIAEMSKAALLPLKRNA